MNDKATIETVRKHLFDIYILLEKVIEAESILDVYMLLEKVIEVVPSTTSNFPAGAYYGHKTCIDEAWKDRLRREEEDDQGRDPIEDVVQEDRDKYLDLLRHLLWLESPSLTSSKDGGSKTAMRVWNGRRANVRARRRPCRWATLDRCDRTCQLRPPTTASLH
ncbi:hypothetical protein MAPG_10740 [Magnaporthiopsis poae ATCC 64411]|uniref:Uncharacterized protein n=1 Tax=Magnaporthiopsis poae (strain ATCC 64411 / 73-15) TaxID=644358 RepID=A0A0C4EDE2_MAGP6|nr:hypothetical protein MAPG_10740 [Magnaporthiopsis poae ATCC 64411]